MKTVTLIIIAWLTVYLPSSQASNVENLFEDLSLATLENIRDNGGINRSTVCDDILSTVYRDRDIGDWKIQTSPYNTYKLALLQEIFSCPSKQVQWVKDSACERSIYGKIFMYGNMKAPLSARVADTENYAKEFLIYNTREEIDSNI